MSWHCMRGAPDQRQNYPGKPSSGAFNITLQIGPNEIDLPAKNKPIASRYVHCGSTIVDVPTRDDRGVSVRLFVCVKWPCAQFVTLFFFLDKAALVVTTVAVMELC